MFKIILAVKKRNDISTEAFKNYYEQKHTALIKAMVPDALLYRRNYIMNGAEIFGIPGASTAEAGFDCFTEIGFETREQAEAHIAAYLDTEKNPVIVDDEANFIEPNGLKFFIVEVHQSRDLIATPGVF